MEKATKWVENVLGEKTLSSKRLLGSTSSVLHEFELAHSSVVLRQFTNEQWLLEEPDLVSHEAASLRKAMVCEINTPKLLAWDESGEKSGIPSVLMTKVEGKVELLPTDFKEWSNKMASALAAIHRIEPACFPWKYSMYSQLDEDRSFNWSSAPGMWKEAMRIAMGPKPPSSECFIHRDYHPANILWTNGEVTGIVDWPNACRGPAGIDVGHCRLNLALLHSVEVADLFLEAYKKHAGSSFMYESYWDIVSVIDGAEGTPMVYPGWSAFGVDGLTDEMIRARLDSYLESISRRN